MATHCFKSILCRHICPPRNRRLAGNIFRGWIVEPAGRDRVQLLGGAFTIGDLGFEVSAKNAATPSGANAL